MHKKIFISIIGLIAIITGFVIWQLMPATKPATLERFAIIVPHHDIMKTKRQDFWQNLLLKYPQTKIVQKIIIIGPDHFGNQQNIISYTDENFTLHNGELPNGLTGRHIPFSNATKNTTLVKSDHAVSVLLTELSHHFPKATLTPFLIGEKLKFADLIELQNFILTDCNNSCLVVASVDFSHNLSLNEANAKDAETLSQLSTSSITEGSLAIPDNADCPACLYIIQELSRNWGNTWYFWDKTNSAGNDTSAINTVSHIYGGYLPK